MKTRYMLDTDISSFVIRGTNKAEGGRNETICFAILFLEPW